MALSARCAAAEGDRATLLQQKEELQRRLANAERAEQREREEVAKAVARCDYHRKHAAILSDDKTRLLATVASLRDALANAEAELEATKAPPPPPPDTTPSPSKCKAIVQRALDPLEQADEALRRYLGYTPGRHKSEEASRPRALPLEEPGHPYSSGSDDDDEEEDGWRGASRGARRPLAPPVSPVPVDSPVREAKRASPVREARPTSSESLGIKTIHDLRKGIHMGKLDDKQRDFLRGRGICLRCRAERHPTKDCPYSLEIRQLYQQMGGNNNTN